MTKGAAPLALAVGFTVRPAEAHLESVEVAENCG